MNALWLNKDKQHVVYLYYARKRRLFNYMVVTLLGVNLKNLKAKAGQFLPASTWVRVGIQALYCLKMVHDIGYIHRDIKPGNFVMGRKRDMLRCRLIHIVDFGLARSFAVQYKGRGWVARRARGSVEFRGTARYCSPAVHEKFEQGRKDDIFSLMYMLIEMHCGLPWQKERTRESLELKKLSCPDHVLLNHFPNDIFSLMYMLIEMHCGLPWQKERTRESLELKKLSCPDHVLLNHFPTELHGIIFHIRSLNCYNRPDYSMIHNSFLQLMQNLGVNYDDKYAWEDDDVYNKWIEQKPVKKYDYEDSAEFFKEDPVGINCAPSKNDVTYENYKRNKSVPSEL
uniref:Protein kinase domain-containing protein n=1 Tax=Panagrolaimus sp. JU765 TaxID=591449 RepID=A0AC34RJP5_9BILA